MGEQLRALFARAHAEGGLTIAGKLAFRVRMTSQEAATLPDTPAQVSAVGLALGELLHEARSGERRGPAATGAPPAPQAPNRIQRYFELAQEKGGLLVVVKLAGKTGLTRQMAATTPDTPETVARVRAALLALLPDDDVPLM